MVSSHYDMSRFGSEVVRFSPRQSDLMIVAGTVTDKMAPVLQAASTTRCPSRSGCISMGACASSGGFYRAYHVMQGIDEIIPVDIYVPGCPPTPEGLIYGILKLQEKIDRGETRSQIAMKARDPAEQASAEDAPAGDRRARGRQAQARWPTPAGRPRERDRRAATRRVDLLGTREGRRPSSRRSRPCACSRVRAPGTRSSAPRISAATSSITMRARRPAAGRADAARSIPTSSTTC